MSGKGRLSLPSTLDAKIGGCNKDGSTCDSAPSRVLAKETSGFDSSSGKAAGEAIAAAVAAGGYTDD